MNVEKNPVRASQLNSDAELVRQAVEGQMSAYDTLVRRWSARVCAYIVARVRSLHVSEELAQEAFLRAYRKLHTLADPEKFGSWLLSIAHRLVLDWRKAKARSEIRLEELPLDERRNVEADSTQALPARAIDKSEELEWLRSAIDGLSEELREVLLIYYYDKVTYRDIAEMLGVSVATVSARLSRARGLLKSRFREGRTSEGQTPRGRISIGDRDAM